MLPVKPIEIHSLADKNFCAKRYDKPYHKIPRPTPTQQCPNTMRICGGNSYEFQYCITWGWQCPINDIKLLPRYSVSRDPQLSMKVWDLTDDSELVVKRDAETHPLVDMKLSENLPCLD